MQGFKFDVPVAVDPGASSHSMKSAGGGPFGHSAVVTVTETPLFGKAPAGSLEPPSRSPGGAYAAVNTTEAYEGSEGNRGQGPQAGDHDWPERHLSEQIVDQEIPGVSDFAPARFDGDVILDVAMGPMTGRQQNPSPDTMLSDNEGRANEPMPSMGSQQPISMPAMFDPGTSPGPQGTGAYVPPLKPVRSVSGMTTKDVHDASQPNDTSAAAMGVNPTINPIAVAAIRRGAANIGLGSGAHACPEASGEPSDEKLPPVQSVPVPPARDAFNVDQYSEAHSDLDLSDRSVSSDVPVVQMSLARDADDVLISPPGPVVYKPENAPRQTV